MSTVALVLGAGVRDLTRSKWLLAYAGGFWGITEALFLFGGTGPQVVLSLLNVVLLLVPLVALVFGTAHVQGSRAFTELLLAQPLARPAVFAGLFLGMVLPLVGAFLGGIGLPLLLHGAKADAPRLALLLLAVSGALLTIIFSAIAMVIALGSDDRVRGMLLAIGVWLGFTVVYDGLILAAISVFGDWPLERPMLVALLGNPIDVARVLVLTSLDASALLGYTGALFRRVLGTALGPIIALSALAAWTTLPILLARRRFVRRDL